MIRYLEAPEIYSYSMRMFGKLFPNRTFEQSVRVDLAMFMHHMNYDIELVGLQLIKDELNAVIYDFIRYPSI